MMKNYLLIATLITSFQLFSQEAYFLTGNNFTKYIFKTSGESMTTKLQVGTGSTYEIGYSIPLKYPKVSYAISLTLDDYNAIAGSSVSSYSWDSKYVGVQNGISYNYPISTNFQLLVNGGLNFSTIIYGKQTINGAVNDLKTQDEFSGMLLLSFIRLQTRYKLNDYGYLSLGYGFSKSLNPFNLSPQKLSFNTNQILFGIHFNINKK
ncbi:hypothetical protein [Flavobacterium sp. 123]|uniref:hypothetical protein n=1 Tax=Flavobacterium sp. 123 TaxID=2135627 RepID=UPI000EB47D9D|nr:hypothetical protein [Flavobacterium sp. 123]RKS98721.1 hypothetical protein C8C88_0470 [Flavobacterium sp. 123]